MTATKIDGTAIAKSIRERLGAKIKERQGANPRYKPGLKIVQGESHAIDEAHHVWEANTRQSATGRIPARMCA
jgi:5,10-methylene-tetrahydrofolate dehydrogenase/methenyl tetrahydrofolate cyclohydrolase